MRARAIVNPHSGGTRTAKRWPEVERALRTALPELEVAFTESAGDATRLTRQALRDGARLVIAVGGDGTVNEVVNGFFDDRGEALGGGAQLGIMMMGTGGDFRRSLSIGAGWEACLARIVTGSARTIDLGRIELTDADGQPVSRMFDNIASFGVSGAIVRAVNTARFSKIFGGAFAFKFSTVVGLAKYRTRPVRIRVDDHFDEVVDLTMCAVCNGQYFGGGMHVGPTAELDDGLLDVVVVEGMGALDFVRHSRKFYAGEHLGEPGIRQLRGRLVIAEPADDRTTLVDLDGEGPGRLPVTIRVVPASIAVRA